jgi:hypothetical protein
MVWRSAVGAWIASVRGRLVRHDVLSGQWHRGRLTAPLAAIVTADVLQPGGGGADLQW